MQLGMIGLGRMGANMVKRLATHGHECVVFDVSPKVVEELASQKQRATLYRSGVASIADMPTQREWITGRMVMMST